MFPMSPQSYSPERDEDSKTKPDPWLLRLHPLPALCVLGTRAHGPAKRPRVEADCSDDYDYPARFELRR